VLDVDGTLVDTSYHHAIAWYVEVPAVAVLTGGLPEQELRQAGAGWVSESLGELCERLDETPLAQVCRSATTASSPSTEPSSREEGDANAEDGPRRHDPQRRVRGGE
jgi:hypothetical protein